MIQNRPDEDSSLTRNTQTFHHVDGAWLDSAEYSLLRLEQFYSQIMEQLYEKYHGHQDDVSPVDTTEGYDWNDAFCGVSKPSNVTRRDRIGQDIYHQPVIVKPAQETGRGLCGLFLVLGVLTIATIVLILILNKGG